MIEIAGIALLPDWPAFLGFAIAGLALNLVPGADMTFIVASAAKGGRRDGLIASFGIGAGSLLHMLAAVFGLSAILASSQTAFDAVKWAGAAYLLYMAIGLLRSGRSAGAPETRASGSGAKLFRAAILVNILNPKVALFFLAFLPQFVDPQAAAPAVQILCLGLWFILAATIVNSVIALAAAGAAERLRHVGWIAKAARIFAATVLGGMAVQLALASRR